MEGTYVTDLRHFLDSAGEIAEMPTEARQMASFLALIVDAVTQQPAENFEQTGLRCRIENCAGFRPVHTHDRSRNYRIADRGLARRTVHGRRGARAHVGRSVRTRVPT